ncbi:MAG: sterol desaturase family protein [Kangiellaceae bacterium]|nr:sterol desaturase family protein [Kangiellaceae bacterium]
MPTPLEILLDPLSLGLLSLYVLLIFLEYLFPARPLPKVNGWILRSMTVFFGYFYLSTYLPLIWDKYLVEYQLLDLSEFNLYLSTLIALLVFELFIYIWHRTMHKTNWLWRSFHQMHHSAERLDSFGAFYFSPLDIIGFTLVGSLALALVVGLSAQAVSLFLYITMFLAIFQHVNINTPRWFGYFIQRPESHSIHHAKNIHAYNYSDLPVFDIIFGTFKNPEHFNQEIGFYHGASAKIPELLFFKDLHREYSESNQERITTANFE